MSKTYSLEEAVREFGKDINKLTDEVRREAKQKIQMLAASAHSMIVEKANSSLSSTRSMYINALNIEKISSDEENEIWAVTLGKEAGFLEEGQPPHNMLDYLINGPKAKTSKDGHKYNIIPFQHNKPANTTSLAQQKLANYVKRELKRQGLDKIVTQDGKPVIGRVATVSITDQKQPVGKFNQPLLKGLTIYQRETTTASGKTKIKRDVMTFRVASEKQRGSGLWDHPGREGLKAFQETAEKLDAIWDQMIREIVEKA